MTTTSMNIETPVKGGELRPTNSTTPSTALKTVSAPSSASLRPPRSTAPATTESPAIGHVWSTPVANAGGISRTSRSPDPKGTTPVVTLNGQVLPSKHRLSLQRSDRDRDPEGNAPGQGPACMATVANFARHGSGRWIRYQSEALPGNLRPTGEPGPHPDLRRRCTQRLRDPAVSPVRQPSMPASSPTT